MSAGRGTRDAGRDDVPALARNASSDVLLAFLRERRWFGAKASAVGARVRDVVALPWAQGRFVVARVEVQLEGGATQAYQVPLQSHEGALADAAGDPEFLRHLANDLAHGGAYEGDAGTRWIVAPEGEQGLVVPPDARIRVGSAEQSNTSIVFADEGMLKLFRKLEPGDHPDVELTRYLTVQAGFAHTPTLLGTIRFEEPGGVTTMAGMLQEFLLGSMDAWAYAVGRGTRDAGRASAFGDFSAEAGKLGRITREMHDCLARATGALAPERARSSDVHEWAEGAKHWINDGMRLLERNASRIPRPASREEAEALASRRDDYLDLIDEIVEEVGDDAGLRTRIHGDYHLGQVLRTASDDFMIIDFEGEPARPLEERRRKASPMRDVAGMLRSFAYAAATMARDAGRGARDANPQVEIAAARWERDTRGAFLSGYFGEGAREADASRAPRPASRLLRLFEAEKVFYELAYELNNRPDWAWIPMRGISKLLVQA